MPKKQLTRAEILKAIGFTPLRVPGIPAKLLRAADRERANYLVGWVRSLATHMDAADKAAGKKRRTRKSAPKGRRKPAK